MRIKVLVNSIFMAALMLSSGLAQAQVQNPTGSKTAPGAAGADPATEGALPGKPVVLSFLEWKSLRVHEAQQKLEQMNKNQQGQVWQEGKSVTPDDKTSGQKLNFNVDVALQLNIQDYFSMYLKTLSPEEFKEATKKLSDDETAELLMAYKNTQEKDKKIPLKFSKNPKDNAKSKNTEI